MDTGLRDSLGRGSLSGDCRLPPRPKKAVKTVGSHTVLSINRQHSPVEHLGLVLVSSDQRTSREPVECPCGRGGGLKDAAIKRLSLMPPFSFQRESLGLMLQAANS